MRDLVYLSYSEERFFIELRRALYGDVRLAPWIWDDRQIGPGDDREQVYQQQVARARIMVILVSPRYLDAARCYAWKFEIPGAIEAQQRGELRICWLAAESVRPEDTPFPTVHALLPPNRPLAAMEDGERARAYDHVRRQLRALLGLDTPDAFDVFLSHNSHDKPAVRELRHALERRGVSGWLDEDHLQPALSSQQQLENGIKRSRSVAVMVGADGLGPWEDEEMQGALRAAVTDKRPVIPVLLPGAPANVKLPMFLGNRVWVDLRAGFTDEGLDNLVWGVTGQRPARDDP